MLYSMCIEGPSRNIPEVVFNLRDIELHDGVFVHLCALADWGRGGWVGGIWPKIDQMSIKRSRRRFDQIPQAFATFSRGSCALNFQDERYTFLQRPKHPRQERQCEWH